MAAGIGNLALFGNTSGGAIIDNGIVGAQIAKVFDVAKYGAVADGVTSIDTAVAKALTDMGAGGGVLFFPPGEYCTTAGIVIGNANNGIRVVGSGSGNTFLMTNGADVSPITFLNCSYCTLEHMYVGGKGWRASDNFSISTSALQITGAVNCLFEDLYIQGGLNCINISSGGDNVFRKVVAAYAYNTAICYSKNTGNWFQRCQFDQTWPVSPNPSQVASGLPNWQATHAYNKGDLVNNGGMGLQCVIAGTSGGTAPANKTYFNNIADGSATWQLAMGQQNYYSIQLDTGCNQNFLFEMDTITAFTSSLGITNTLSGAVPGFTMISDSNFGGGISNAIDIRAGSGVQVNNSTLGSVLSTSGAGIALAAAVAGDVIIRGCIINASGFGILVNGGTNIIISDNDIGGCTTGIQVAAGLSKIIISNNMLGGSVIGGGANGTAVVMVASSDYYNIVNNIIHGASTGISDATPGAHNTKTGNI